MYNRNLSLSFVIPTYNDSPKLYKSIKYLQRFLSDNFLKDFEVIIVNDGGEKINDYSLALRCKIINLPNNLGKGGAVCNGVEYAKKDYIVILDSDIPFYLDQLLSIEKSDECLFSNRFYKVSSYYQNIPIKRKYASFIFKFFIYALFQIKEDTQCGYKIYKNDLCKAIYGEIETKGYAFEIEAVLLAKKMKAKIREFDVKLRERQYSRISLILDGLPMLIDVIIIYIRIKRKKREAKNDSSK